MSLRTPRTIARSHGAKVPAMPARQGGYCGVHGMVHASGSCNYAAVDAEAEAVAGQGGGTAATARTTPFKLGGGR